MTKRPQDRHADEETLRALAGGQLEPQVVAHTRSCPTCAEGVALYRALQVGEQVWHGECPEAELLVRFAAETPLDARRSPLRSHVSTCGDCRTEVQALRRVATEQGRLPLAPVRTRVPSLAARLRSLVRFELPVPILLSPRGPREPGSTSLRDAIEAMQARRPSNARAALRRARRAGDNSPAIDFYLGVLLLEQGRTTPAIEALQRAVRSRHRSAESRFFLAQAWLRRGEAAEALEHLRVVRRLKGPHQGAARTLAQQVQEMISTER